MSHRPALIAVPRPRDLVAAQQPTPQRPDPDEPEDGEDEAAVAIGNMAALDAMPPLPARFAGHFPPRIPAAAETREEHAETYLTRAKPDNEVLVSFTARIPLGMRKQLDRLCAERGLEKSGVLREALGAHLRAAFAPPKLLKPAPGKAQPG